MSPISTPSLFGLNQKILLVILDGFGLQNKDLKNAVIHAKKPNLDNLFTEFPMTAIEPGGTLVGLPKGVPGNSEVGHMNLGAGRSVRQDLVRINEAIAQNTLKDMPQLLSLIDYAKKNSNRIHLMGLLSDGGVHSHIDHLKAIVHVLSSHNIELYLHAFTDGRDTARDSGINYVNEAMNIPGLTFASLQGRSIGMDRDRRWEKIEECYKCLVGMGHHTKLSPLLYLKNEYAEGRFDEFASPVLFTANDQDQNHSAIKKQDAIFFFNFRPDRAIQITTAFADPNFKEFQTPLRPGFFLCMTPYVQDYVDLPILFDKEKLSGTLCQYLSQLQKKQFKIAETEKYAHVTYFFNGGEKLPFPGEEQILIPSPKEVSTYDQKPEMSAYLVADRLLLALENNQHDLYVVNFANADMVGHTGNYTAAIAAIEALDQIVGKLKEKCFSKKIAMIITADHGNADQMAYENGDIHTSHTDSLVPFVVVSPELSHQKLRPTEGPKALRDVAPTILHLMGLKMPPSFEGTPIFN